jgi:hypothetical protein
VITTVKLDRRDVRVYAAFVVIAAVIVWGLATGSPENPVGHAYRVIAELLTR